MSSVETMRDLLLAGIPPLRAGRGSWSQKGTTAGRDALPPSSIPDTKTGDMGSA